MEKHTQYPKKQINTKMVSGMSQNTIIFNDGIFYIDFENVSSFFEKNINLLNNEDKREDLVREYGNEIVGFFNDFKNINVGKLEKIQIENIEQDGKNIEIHLLENSVDKEKLFILEILNFLFKLNKKTISFYIGKKEIKYSLLKSEEFILNNLLNKLNLSKNQGEKINEEIEKILTKLGKKYEIFNKIKESFGRKIYFGDLHKNEHFGLEFGGFSKANFLANQTGLSVESGFLDNLTGFKNNFPDVVDIKKGVSSQASIILGDKEKIKIRSIEELLEKKLEKLLNGNLDISNFEKLFTNLGLAIFENLDYQNDFYQKLIGSKNNSSNNAIKLFLEDNMKKRFFQLFRGIKTEVLEEIKNFKNGDFEDNTLLKRKILVIFNNFLNTQIYNQILSYEEKDEYINNGILDRSGKFNQELESAKYISGENSKYQETKKMINLFLEDNNFGGEFIYKLFENIFNSVDKKSVYLMTLNINGKNIDFNLIKENSEILVSFGEEKLHFSDFINNYFNGEFNIISITGKLGSIKSILNGDLVLASERGVREVLINTFKNFLSEGDSLIVQEDLEKLIIDLKLVDDFEENKKISEYNNFPVTFSEIIPQKNVLLAYLLGDDLVEKQLSSNKKEEKNIDLELKYQNKINEKINNYLQSIGLNRQKAIKKIQDIKYFLETEEFGENVNKTDIGTLSKVLILDEWISMEGFQLLMQNKLLEQEFIDSELLKEKLNGKKYINVEMFSFEEEIQELQKIYNNTFSEYQLFIEKVFLDNIKQFYKNKDYNFKIHGNTYSSFLSKIQFYSTLSLKIFGKEKGIGNNILENIFKEIEEKIIENLNLENYADSLIFISNLEKLGIKEFEYMGFGKQDDTFLEQINNSFNKEFNNTIVEIELIFKMKIDFIKNIKGITFLVEKNDLIIKDYFERMIFSNRNVS